MLPDAAHATTAPPQPCGEPRCGRPAAWLVEPTAALVEHGARPDPDALCAMHLIAAVSIFRASNIPDTAWRLRTIEEGSST